jgi:hypothetical protein
MYQHLKQLCLGSSDSSQSTALAFSQLEFVSPCKFLFSNKLELYLHKLPFTFTVLHVDPHFCALFKWWNIITELINTEYFTHFLVKFSLWNFWKCGNLNVSQPYGPPQPVTGIVLPFQVQIFSKEPCSQTASIYVLPFMWKTRFQTHTNSTHNTINSLWIFIIWSMRCELKAFWIEW